jgi:nitrous oxide reductase accessory protein NosL
MRVFLICTALLLAFGLVAQAKEPQRPRCENCGMFTDVSPTNVHAMLKINGKEAEHNFVCLGCVYEFMHEKVKGEAKLTGLKVLDYKTFGTKTPKFIDGMTAWYLVGTKPLDGSMEPYMAAFASKDAAAKAQKTLGGEVKNYKDTWATLGAKEEGNSDAAVYTCPMHPEVQQNHPGKCPKCGMNLVKKGSK